MKNLQRVFILFLLVLSTMCVKAQPSNAVRGIFQAPGDSAVVADSARIQEEAVNQDSLLVVQLQQSLAEAKLSEANLRMEFEQYKLNILASDSIKLRKQWQHIDSLRRITRGCPVLVDGDTLFFLYTKKGGQTALQRAQETGGLIEGIGKKINLDPNRVYVESTDIFSDIMYDTEVLVSFTDADAMWEGVSRDSLAANRKQIVVGKLREMNRQYGIWRTVQNVFYCLLVLVAQFFLYRLTCWGFSKLEKKILALKDTTLKPIKIQSYEILNTEKQVALLLVANRIVKYAVVLLQLLISLPIIFGIFPSTKGFALQLLGYFIIPIKKIAYGVIDYIPNLISIIVIWYVTKSLVRLARYIALEIENGNLKLNNFFPEWAMPTFNIVRFLLYAFMVAMIYNYLPGSDSGVFQGISVFVGLIISLGSSTLIANLMAGLVITFMRPFRIGDRIKLNDTMGDIIEKTPLVTRVKTPKNEIVTVPNSFVMSSLTTNYSSSAQEYGLIIHSDVTFGYEVPWQQVHQLLIKAALATPYIEAEPAPFVLQTKLDDWYVVYQINAYTRRPEKMALIYSELHQNVQDLFNEAGIEIMSPHFMGVRKADEVFMPEEYLQKKEKKNDNAK
ncbi:MAG: mechanosensitive ion channel family protein [Bacteroidaceae bacterium]|nr:mechanosensitive ion channel family protein [Bacteroidaceae bacterium]